ncbi:hypothetical protein TNCV_2803761 [Trichonephila clavipes]|nr:hypothetical protein TNCV_2803761 [Trichonephila clavipes]
MGDTLRRLTATKCTFHHFQQGYELCYNVYEEGRSLFNGLLCKAVSTSANFVFIMNALPDRFLSATDPVSRNRCTKRVLSLMLSHLDISPEMHLSIGNEIL